MTRIRMIIAALAIVAVSLVPATPVSANHSSCGEYAGFYGSGTSWMYDDDNSCYRLNVRHKWTNGISNYWTTTYTTLGTWAQSGNIPQLLIVEHWVS